MRKSKQLTPIQERLDMITKFKSITDERLERQAKNWEMRKSGNAMDKERGYSEFAIYCQITDQVIIVPVYSNILKNELTFMYEVPEVSKSMRDWKKRGLIVLGKV